MPLLFHMARAGQVAGLPLMIKLDQECQGFWAQAALGAASMRCSSPTSVFAVVAGGMFVRLGPTVGALFTILLGESLRIAVGNEVHGLDGTIYGLLLVIFIIYMPKGILGALLDLATRRAGAPPPGRLQAAGEAAE